MNSYYLPIRNARGDGDGVTLQGELISQSSVEQNIRRGGAVCRRTTCLMTFRTASGLVSYRYWKEVGANDWFGRVQVYPRVIVGASDGRPAPALTLPLPEGEEDSFTGYGG
jgi:hypothetical protein